MRMKLVQNTTDIADETIEAILHNLGGDDLSCAVRVRNCWNSPCFVGMFYAELAGTVVEPNGKVYELGGRKHGCKHVISMRVPCVCIPMPARTGDGKRVWIQVPDRVTGLALLAAHELEHARRYEARLDYRNEIACDEKKLDLAKRLGLRISERRDSLTQEIA